MFLDYLVWIFLYQFSQQTSTRACNLRIYACFVSYCVWFVYLLCVCACTLPWALVFSCAEICSQTVFIYRVSALFGGRTWIWFYLTDLFLVLLTVRKLSGRSCLYINAIQIVKWERRFVIALGFVYIYIFVLPTPPTLILSRARAIRSR